MSESLENDRGSSGSIGYSFSINWDGSKRLTIVNFTLCHDPRLKHSHPSLSSIIFEDRFVVIWGSGIFYHELTY